MFLVSPGENVRQIDWRDDDGFRFDSDGSFAADRASHPMIGMFPQNTVRLHISSHLGGGGASSHPNYHFFY